MQVAVGVDSHKSTLAVAAVDALGVELGVREFRNEPSDHIALKRWIEGFGGEALVGIECTGSYAAGLTRFLVAAGLAVREVPANLTRAEARRGRRGKSDPLDALAIARIVARGWDELPSVERRPDFADLKLLADHRDQLVRHRTKLLNRIHKDLVVVLPGYERTLPSIKSARAWREIVELLEGDDSVRADLIRDRVEELSGLAKRIRQVERDLLKRVRATGTSLTALTGVGPVLAARILGETGDVARFRSKAAFASMAGTAPLPASSGKTERHRLSRHGNRQLNLALFFFALVSYRCDPESQAYVKRKMGEGKGFKEAIRCLQRQLTNVVYRLMVADQAAFAEVA